MSYYPTNEDISIIRQQEKDVYIKTELLNKQFKILESISGNIISDNLNVDSEAKQRRNYTCTMHVVDSSFLIGSDKKIWIDKYIRVYYGVRSIRTNKIHWTKIGTFTYTDTEYTYSSTDNTLSLYCGDMMADYDGTKNGQIDGYSLTIPAGEDIRQSIIATLNDAGITNYIVEDIEKEIPYDLTFNDSKTYCDVWTKICELYDSWEFFFDVDGMFIWRKKPTGLSDQIAMDDSMIDSLFISEKQNNSFTGVYNVTEIWGKVLELEFGDRYTDISTFSNGIYHITLEGVSSYEDINHLDRIGIKICNDSTSGSMININNIGVIPIVNDDGSYVAAERLKANTTYIFSFRRNMAGIEQNCLCLLGQYQAYGIYKEMSKECPFSVTNLGYEIINRVNYDNLHSDDLCFNQAEYNTYKSSAMLDTITLNIILIPWLEVNQKIEYTSKETGEKNQYIIKNFSWSTLDGTMTLTLYRFLESFSYVTRKQKIYPSDELYPSEYIYPK